MNRTKSSCLKCNVYSAYKHKQFQDGAYRNMFDLEQNSQNHNFVANPYKQNVCHPGTTICFSTINGSGKCKRIPNQILGWDIQGKNLEVRTNLARY